MWEAKGYFDSSRCTRSMMIDWQVDNEFCFEKFNTHDVFVTMSGTK